MRNRPIGIFDSGFGGLTALKRLRELMPEEDIVYFADSGRMPYGGRSTAELRCIARQNMDFLKSFDAKLAIAACGTLQEILELTGKTVDKIILEVSSLEEMETYRHFLSEDQYLLLSENRIAMIMNRKATKANGIRLLAQRHGISLEDIVAFGDDYNDIDMLKTCGVGVAMANALEAVKESADAVCSSNDEDGVAHWLANALTIQ